MTRKLPPEAKAMSQPPQADVFVDLRRARGNSNRASDPGRDAQFQTASQGRRRKRIYIPSPPIDGVYAFLLCSAMLFVQQAGSLSGVAMASLPLLYLTLRSRRAREVFAQSWVLLILPLFCLSSMFWSEAPGVSAKYGLEMCLTAMAGIGLAVAERPSAVLKGLCLAFAVYVFTSLGLGRFTGVGVGLGGEAFVGLTDGKNLVADIAATGVLLSLTTLLISIGQRNALWALFSAASAAVEGYEMLLARSAGATLALGAALVILLGIVCVSAMPKPVRGTMIGFVLVSAGILITSIHDIGAMLLNVAASLFDKDPTLTGRTYLWYRAQDLIHAKPLLGTGYFAFWRQGNLDAEGLWRYAGITGRGGFNFHNAFVELSVELGIIGATLFCVIGLIGVLALVRHLIVQPTLAKSFWLTYLLYEAIRAPTEAIGYAPFYYSTCLLFAGACAGLQRLSPRTHRSRRYVGQALRLQYYARPARGRPTGVVDPAQAR
jgi:exopolysaccharide production protein ExoQ